MRTQKPIPDFRTSYRGRRPRIGLALGAGVARGWSHIGVLRALEENGIRPDVVAGTSVGAVVGGAYVAGALDALEVWARGLKRMSFLRYMDFRLRRSGLVSGQKLTALMEEHFGHLNIEDLSIPFRAVACELQTGHEIWLKTGKLVDAVRASFALPGAFEAANIGGRWLADGALVNPVPVSVCRAYGAELVIAVNLAEDIYGRARAAREGVVTAGKFGLFSDDVERQALRPRSSRNMAKRMFAHEKDQPSLFATMLSSLMIMQNRLSRSRLAGEPPDVMITPRCGHVGLMEFHRADELITVGAEAIQDALPQIEDALAIIGYQMNDST